MMETHKDFSFTLGAWQSFLIIALIVWVYCIVDVLRHKSKNDGKVIWLLIVLFLPILGAILYLFAGKSRRILND